jgi:hypothetical protein
MSSKTYLRYEEAGSFGVIAAHDGNVVVDENGLLAFAAGLGWTTCWRGTCTAASSPRACAARTATRGATLTS